MRKIASTPELQDELRRLIAYAETAQPSRARIADALEDLSDRVAGTKIAAGNLAVHLDRGFTSFLEECAGALAAEGYKTKVYNLMSAGAGASGQVNYENESWVGSVGILFTDLQNVTVRARGRGIGMNFDGEKIGQKETFTTRRLTAQDIVEEALKVVGEINTSIKHYHR
jgi:hypothetical protein